MHHNVTIFWPHASSRVGSCSKAAEERRIRQSVILFFPKCLTSIDISVVADTDLLTFCSTQKGLTKKVEYLLPLTWPRSQPSFFLFLSHLRTLAAPTCNLFRPSDPLSLPAKVSSRKQEQQKYLISQSPPHPQLYDPSDRERERERENLMSWA